MTERWLPLLFLGSGEAYETWIFQEPIRKSTP